MLGFLRQPNLQTALILTCDLDEENFHYGGMKKEILILRALRGYSFSSMKIPGLDRQPPEQRRVIKQAFGEDVDDQTFALNFAGDPHQPRAE
jgi:hypothetical protein